MRHETLTIALAALLAFGVSGAVAAPVTELSPATDEQPSDYTVEVIDPDDRLTDEEIAEMRHLAWSRDDVRAEFEDTDTVHFQIEAVDGDLQVYLAIEEDAPPQVVVDIAHDDGEVTQVETLDNVVAAGDVESVELSPVNDSMAANGSTVTFDSASDTTVLSAENSTNVETVDVTGVETDSDAVTVQTANETAD